MDLIHLTQVSFNPEKFYNLKAMSGFDKDHDTKLCVTEVNHYLPKNPELLKKVKVSKKKAKIKDLYPNFKGKGSEWVVGDYTLIEIPTTIKKKNKNEVRYIKKVLKIFVMEKVKDVKESISEALKDNVVHVDFSKKGSKKTKKAA